MNASNCKLDDFTRSPRPVAMRFSTADSVEWQIPFDCKVLRALLDSRRLRAEDFRFRSASECQNFIRQLFLLSYADELSSGCASPIAGLGQQLLKAQEQSLESELWTT